MSELPAIEVEHLGKKFAKSLRKAMVYGLRDITRAALLPGACRSPGFAARLSDSAREGVPSFQLPPLRPTEFWALQDMNFKLNRGESLGLVGANGAGKSTLFSILSGIYSPTTGSATIRGRLQALIALGAGFHPALSGRENVYINAAILGMGRKRVDELMERIIDFADIGDFIHSPVKNYSSGMLVRLGFSIAVHMDPDVLLIDEVLAVGDAAFQIKCARFARDLVGSGKTLVIVSHNMLIIQMMSTRAMWLDHGKLVEEGSVHDVVEKYKKFMVLKDMKKDAPTESDQRNILAVMRSVRWIDREGRPVDRLVGGQSAGLLLEIDAVQDIDCGRVWVQVGAVGRDTAVMGATMFEDGHYVTLRRGLNRVAIHWEHLPLGHGNYCQVYAGVRDWSGNVLLADSFATDVFDLSEPPALCLNGKGEARTVQGTLDALARSPYRWEMLEGAVLKSDAGVSSR